MSISFYEIDPKYINYLAPHEPLLFHNAKPGQANTRKYIGVIFQVGNFSYFAPLSSLINQAFSSTKSRLSSVADVDK